MKDLIENRTIHQYIYRHFSRTVITILAIASEIDAFCQLKNETALRHLWGLMAGYVEEAKDVYEERYESLLSPSGYVPKSLPLAPIIRSQEDLKSMAGHVRYEITEFTASARRLRELKPQRGAGKEIDRSEWNRALESMLLHFRVLRDFFGEKPKDGNAPKKDDVRAEEYLTKWSPSGDALFADTRNRINKRLTHLTWERLKEGQDWPELDAMKKAIDDTVERFIKALPPNEAGWFRDPLFTITRGVGGIGTLGNRTDSGNIP
jgi:hypothetical protein